MTGKQKKLLRRILISAAMTLLLVWLPAKGVLRLVLYLIPYWIVGHDVLRRAWKGIRNRQVFDESFLMSLATIGALVLGFTRSGEYGEAVAVMLFYQVGELFQSYAVGRSRRSIRELMDIRPDTANLEREGRLEQVDPEEVEVGSVLVVRPGEKVPIDGVVEEGESSLNTSALTGESAPRDVMPGDEVLSGCINLSGVLRVRTTREFGESTASRILDLVENASSRKSRSEDFIARFARIYTPAVCACALALLLLPPLALRLFWHRDPAWTVWAYRALAFLVASCPCALVVSVPLSFFAGLGGASREGILVKGSNYLEALSKTGCVVFDKTGTLTRGVFEVSEIHSLALPEAELLECAALAESDISHPIAQSLRRAWGGEPDRGRVREIREISGSGVTALVDGRAVAVGNTRLMDGLGLRLPVCTAVGTVVHVAVDGTYAGYIVISDALKPGAREAVAALRSAGVGQAVMLTGDAAAVAEKTAAELGMDRAYGELLPGDKVARVEELLSDMPGRRKLAFVGDGINDAPVLARADIGIAMGALGSDAAIEAADVVLMDDDPGKIVKSIRISRKCLGIVYENIVFAIAVKVLSLVLVALGAAGMWLAIFADVGVMVLAVLNAVRALFVKKL